MLKKYLRINESYSGDGIYKQIFFNITYTMSEVFCYSAKKQYICCNKYLI